MTKPRVSVILPAYNAERFIGEAIDSILAQTYRDFELIIINDGSTDLTPDIIRQYAKKDKRIRFFNNRKNRGLIYVLNMGLRKVRGEYIARMDADDISLPTRFEKQVAYMDANPDVGVLGTVIEAFGIYTGYGIQKPVVELSDFITDNYVAHPTVMIRGSVMRKYGFQYNPEYKHVEDYELWMRMVQVTKIHNISEVLLRYRVTGDNVSITNNSEQKERARQLKNVAQQMVLSQVAKQKNTINIENPVSVSIYD